MHSTPAPSAFRLTGGTSGLQSVVDEVSRRAGTQPNFHTALWTLTWNRGYDDMHIAAPQGEMRYDGVLVFLRAFVHADLALAVLDTTRGLVAIFCRTSEAGPLVERLGDLVSARGFSFSRTSIAWTFRLAASLAFGIDVAFDRDVRSDRIVDAPWLVMIGEALERIRHAEQFRRRTLHADRARITHADAVETLDDEIKAAREAIRTEVETRSAYTDEERRAFARTRIERQSTNARIRAKAVAAEREVVAARQARFDTMLRERLAAFADALPAFREEYLARATARRTYIAAVAACEAATAESKAATERTAVIERRLAYIVRSTMRIAAIDAHAMQTGDHRALLGDLYRSVELLYRAIPERHLGQIDRSLRSA